MARRWHLTNRSISHLVSKCWSKSTMLEAGQEWEDVGLARLKAAWVDSTDGVYNACSSERGRSAVNQAPAAPSRY